MNEGLNKYVSSKKRDYQENHLKILHFFKRYPDSTVKDCSEEYNLTERTVYNHLKDIKRNTK